MAIALVVLFHSAGLAAGHPPTVPREVSIAGAYLYGGHTGVTLFFVLSGFLLAPPFVLEARGLRIISRSTFFVRRARRVLPVYYLAVVVATVASAGSAADLLRGVPYLFFLNSIPDTATRLWPWSGVWWSLATEVQFYLLLPIVAYLGRRWRRLLWLTLTIYAAAYVLVVAGAVREWARPAQVLLLASVFGRAPAFAFGAIAGLAAPSLCAALDAKHAASSWWRAASEMVFIVLLLALALLLRDVAALGYLVAELQWSSWHSAEALLWGSIVLLVVAVPLRSTVVFCNTPMQALGRWSYSLYLIHYPALWYVFGPATSRSDPLTWWDFAKAGAVIAACIAASAASYRFIERPFLAPRSLVAT